MLAAQLISKFCTKLDIQIIHETFPGLDEGKGMCKNAIRQARTNRVSHVIWIDYNIDCSRTGKKKVP